MTLTVVSSMMTQLSVYHLASNMGIFILLTSVLFFNTNAEFFEVSEQQLSEGYTWHKVGVSTPSGAPALVLEPSPGREIIIYRLEK